MALERESVDAKVIAIFREFVGDRADRLSGSRPAMEAMATLGGALAEDFGEQARADIAFHLADWNSDAAFIVAVHLFPERFTAEEICDGVRDFVIHAPNHVAAAAKLAGHPIQDVWELGVLDGE